MSVRGPRSPRFFYGYVNSVLAGVALFLVGGANYVFTSMSGFMKEDMGWSATATGLGFSLFYVVFGGVAILSGILVLRFGPRLMIGAGGALIVASSLLLSMTGRLWQFYLLAALFAAGVACGSVVPGPQLASNWLHKHRGLVIGLQFAAAGLGGSVLALVGERVMSACDSWRPSWLVTGALVLLSVILAATVIRNRPEDLGQKIDGVRDLAELVEETDASTRGTYKCLNPWTFREAATTPTLWLIVVSFGLSDYVFFGMLSHQVPFLIGEVGVSPATAAGVLALMVGFMAVGKAGGGWLADKIEPRKTLGMTLLMLAAGLALLLVWRSTVALYLYVVLLGAGYGACLTQTSATLANYYGHRYLSALMGATHGSAMLLAALSAFVTGALHDYAGSYVLPFLVMLGLAVVGSACAFIAPIPGRSIATMPQGVPGAAGGEGIQE